MKNRLSNFSPKHSTKFFYLLPLICSLSTRAEERKEKDPNTGLLFADLSEPYPRDATDRDLEPEWTWFARSMLQCVTVKEGALFYQFHKHWDRSAGGQRIEVGNDYSTGLTIGSSEAIQIDGVAVNFYRFVHDNNGLGLGVYAEASFVRVAGYPEIAKVAWVEGREATLEKKGLLKVTFANIGQIRLSRKYFYYVSTGKKGGSRSSARAFRLNLKVNEKVDVFLPIPRLTSNPVRIQLGEYYWQPGWTTGSTYCDRFDLDVSLDDLLAKKLPPRQSCVGSSCFALPGRQ